MKQFTALAVVLVVLNMFVHAGAPLNYQLRYPRWNSNGAHYPVRSR